MKDKARRLDIVALRGAGPSRKKDLIARESPVTIFLNDAELVTLLCTPCDLEPLAVGFLFSEGFITGMEDIKKVFAEARGGAVWVETKSGKTPSRKAITRRLITTGCGKRLSFADMGKGLSRIPLRAKPRLTPDSVASLMKEFQKASELYTLTGGVHSAGLADEKEIVHFSEDIGRHNAVDKVLGRCLMHGVKLDDKILITSGRISSDILAKAGRGRIPAILSRAAPTDLAVKLARDLNVTLVGFARGRRMNVYSGERRIDLGRPVRRQKTS